MTPGPLLVTPGEPAGIGPELVCTLAATEATAWVAVADPELLRSRAQALGLGVDVITLDHWDQPISPAKGRLHCHPVALPEASVPGELNPANARYVLQTLKIAAGACLSGKASGLVTGPVHKGIINEAGVAFTGHTEYLQALAGVDRVVMMLIAQRHTKAGVRPLRVALVTTHLPLAQVPSALSADLLQATLQIVDYDLKTRFGLATPKLHVLGLNPHAGEGGHLGSEEEAIISPVIQSLKSAGLDLRGPLPADTAFVPSALDAADAVVAMYHDQGLPVLKHIGFGDAVNVTLGLPFIRTSVDHGTALDIAGQGVADAGSLKAALALAQSLRAASP